MSQNALLQTQPAPTPPASRRPPWALPVVIVAVLAIAVALVVGLRGLGGNPVISTAPDGTATISGSWEPFECSGGCVQGYVQAGARSVFVRLPAGCHAPAREARVMLRGRPAPSLGSHAYTAVGCPTG
jgi:hypothetical protein